MKYNFNPFERAVGIFLVGALGGSMFFGVGIAIKKNWFEDKNYYYTHAKNADNIREGASVQISGMNIGKIEDIDLLADGKIKVMFSVLKKYQASIKEDAKVQFIRPFIIGEKIINITKGESINMIKNGSMLVVNETTDVMDLMTGDKMKEMIGKTETILTLVEQVLIVGKDIATQVGDKKKLQKTMDNVAYASDAVRKVLPLMVSKSPEMAQNVTTIVSNLSALTSSLKEMQPIVAEVVKTLPDGSKKAIEALNESVTILRAMQKSFLLKGAVADLKEEEEQKRTPAGQKD